VKLLFLVLLLHLRNRIERHGELSSDSGARAVKGLLGRDDKPVFPDTDE
jgi:hypothetical protein